MATVEIRFSNRFWGRVWTRFRDQARLLIQPSDRVLAMISAGPDSTAMAYWLHFWSRERGFSLRLVYMDHGLRRPDRALALAQDLSRRLGVELDVIKIPMKATARKRGMGLEEAGRFLRYRAALALARRRRCNKVAAGHTLDEQAETVLLNILRGGSSEGLKGARPQQWLPASKEPGPKVQLVRPMLKVRKAEILEFLKANQISYFDDPMNQDPRFLRARIRHEILPKLCELHPHAAEHFAGLAYS